MKECLSSGKTKEYCECAWKELRKSASPADIEAGLFDRQAFTAAVEKSCGQIKPKK
jgi:hypothetical protein